MKAVAEKKKPKEAKPILPLERQLLPIDEYAAREGVSSEVIEECSELGIAQLRKYKINFVYITEDGTEEIIPDDVIDIKDRKKVFEAFDEYSTKGQGRGKGKSPTQNITKKSTGRKMLMRKA